MKSPVVNLEYLKKLLGRQQEEVDTILSLIIQYTPGFLAEIHTLIEAHNWHQLKIKVHALKSYFGYLGNQELNSMLSDWEVQLINNAAPFNHEQRYNEVDAYSQKAMEEINAILGHGVAQ